MPSALPRAGADSHPAEPCRTLTRRSVSRPRPAMGAPMSRPLSWLLAAAITIALLTTGRALAQTPPAIDAGVADAAADANSRHDTSGPYHAR